MAHLELSVLVDGIKSIGTHNNVHRIECYRLTAENKPEPAVELIIPAASLSGFIAALARISARYRQCRRRLRSARRQERLPRARIGAAALHSVPKGTRRVPMKPEPSALAPAQGFL